MLGQVALHFTTQSRSFLAIGLTGSQARILATQSLDINSPIITLSGPVTGSIITMTGTGSFTRLVVGTGQLGDNSGQVTVGIRRATGTDKAVVAIMDNFSNNSYPSQLSIQSNDSPAIIIQHFQTASAVNDQTVTQNNAIGVVAQGQYGRGIFVSPQYTGPVTISGSRSYQSYLYLQTATLLDHIGYMSRGQFAASPATASTVTDFYAAEFVSSPSNGVIGTRYGLRIDFTTSSVTQSAFGVYQSNFGVKNWFAGGISSSGFTGSLLGTSSWAVSASWAPSSTPLINSITTSISSGSNKILLFDTSSLNGGFFEYILTSASNARAGNITSIWVNGTSSYNETSTVDIGITSYVTCSIIMSSSFAVFNINIPTNNSWSFKTFYKSI
jgi:hypothetical protein